MIDRVTDSTSPGIPAVPPQPLRVLFVAEAVTLAHVSRPLALAQTLDRERYAITFACGDAWASFIDNAGFTRYPIPTMSPEEFASRLSKGRRIFTRSRLAEYVKAELDLLAKTSPDVVVGDFRVSLRISTAVAGVPYVALANAYWSPFSTLPFPMPEHPSVRLLGPRVSRALLPAILPLVFHLHTRDFNRLCRQYGLPPTGSLGEMYTSGDWTLYLDIPTLAPTANLPTTHRYIGPVVWEAPASLPAWWDEVANDSALVYVALGSSGDRRLWDPVMEAVAALPLRAAVATAGRPVKRLSSNVFTAEYLPGLKIASRAALVVSNGGSPTAYQALACGVPVLGMPSNADQYLMMESVAREGAGILIRAGQATAARIRTAIQTLLQDGSYRQNAARIKAEILRFNAQQAFGTLLDRFRSDSSLLPEEFPRPTEPESDKLSSPHRSDADSLRGPLNLEEALAKSSDIQSIAFTGERIIPELDNYFFQEHLARYRLASTYVKPHDRVLDVGCGDGYGTFYLAAHSGEAVGVDVSADAIAIAQRKYRRPNLAYQAAGRDAQWGVSEHSFDVATFFEVFEHVADPTFLLRQVRRALKPDGLLIISTPNKAVYGRNLPDPFHVREYSLAEFRQIVDGYFVVTEVLGQRQRSRIRKEINFWMARQAMRFPSLLRPLNWVLAKKRKKYRDAAYFDALDLGGVYFSGEAPDTADYFVLIAKPAKA